MNNAVVKSHNIVGSWKLDEIIWQHWLLSFIGFFFKWEVRNVLACFLVESEGTRLRIHTSWGHGSLEKRLDCSPQVKEEKPIDNVSAGLEYNGGETWKQLHTCGRELWVMTYRWALGYDWALSTGSAGPAVQDWVKSPASAEGFWVESLCLHVCRQSLLWEVHQWSMSWTRSSGRTPGSWPAQTGTLSSSCTFRGMGEHGGLC